MENTDIQEMKQQNDEENLIDTTGIIVYEPDDPRLIDDEEEHEILDTTGIIIY